MHERLRLLDPAGPFKASCGQMISAYTRSLCSRFPPFSLRQGAQGLIGCPRLHVAAGGRQRQARGRPQPDARPVRVRHVRLAHVAVQERVPVALDALSKHEAPERHRACPLQVSDVDLRSRGVAQRVAGAACFRASLLLRTGQTAGKGSSNTRLTHRGAARAC